jgi:Rad3-related DNA helicase
VCGWRRPGVGPFITAFIHERNPLGGMGVEEAGDGLRPEQKEILDGLVKRFFVDGRRCLLVEAPTGVGKTRVALEFVREFWRRRGRCRVLVVVPRRVLAYNPWKKEIDRWMSDLEPKCLILSGFMPPRERVLALSSFQGDFLLMTAIALKNDYRKLVFFLPAS